MSNKRTFFYFFSKLTWVYRNLEHWNGAFFCPSSSGSYICTSLTLLRDFSLRLLHLFVLMQFTYPPVVPLYQFMMYCETEDRWRLRRKLLCWIGDLHTSAMLCQDSLTKCVCVGHNALGCQSVPEVTSLISVYMSLKYPFFLCTAWLLSHPVPLTRLCDWWAGNSPTVGTVLYCRRVHVWEGCILVVLLGVWYHWMTPVAAGQCHRFHSWSLVLIALLCSILWHMGRARARDITVQASLSARDLSCWNDPWWKTVTCWRLRQGNLSDLTTTASHHFRMSLYST